VHRTPPDPDPHPRRRARPAAPEAKSAGPSEGGTGFLTLDTDPWAIAYLGGRRLGITPFAHVSLPAGKHQLQLDLQGSGRTRPLVVRIAAGVETRTAVHVK
jgi:hypothetical protein